MPWPVYSERFLHHQGQGSWTWEVPAGTRALITNLDVVNVAGVFNHLELWVAGIAVAYLDFQAGDPPYHVDMKVVAYQGEEVLLYNHVAGLHSTVCGSLLADDTGHTGPPLAPGQLPSPSPVPPVVGPRTPATR